MRLRLLTSAGRKARIRQHQSKRRGPDTRIVRFHASPAPRPGLT
jgi:hypothetical protein